MTRTKPVITLKHMLDWYDGPLLILAEDEDGRPYMGIWGAQKETTYLLVRLPKETAEKWLAGTLDTRSTLLEAEPDGRSVSGDMPGEGQPYTDLRPYPDSRVDKEFMPGQEWFISGKSVFDRTNATPAT